MGGAGNRSKAPTAGSSPPGGRDGEGEDESHEDDGAEPGEWRHGWQFSACSIRGTHFRGTLLPHWPQRHQALRRSGSGPTTGAWLTALHSCPATTIRPAFFQVALRRLLRLPVWLGSRRGQGHCGGCLLDRQGDHVSSCPTIGFLQRRAKPLERAWAQVLHEGGARTVRQPLLRDMDHSTLQMMSVFRRSRVRLGTFQRRANMQTRYPGLLIP